MHQFLLGEKQGYVIDHKNRDTSDNRTGEDNLRFALQGNNCKNHSIRKDNKTGCSGVQYLKVGKKRWKADISVDGKRICLGSYLTKEEATKVRKEAEIKYWGEYAPN